MAESNALIVEVVGDTSRLSASLSKADRDLQRFAGRASSWDARFAANAQKSSRIQEDAAARRAKAAAAAEAEATSLAGAGRASGIGLGLIGIAASTAYQGLQKISEGLKVTGREATTTEGQLRNAGSALTRFDLIGTILAFNVRRQADSWQEAKKELDDYQATNRSWLGTLSRSTTGLRDFIDKTEELVGLDPKLAALQDGFEKLWAAAHPPTDIDFSAISTLGGAFSGFGITPLDPTLRPKAPTRKGVTASQRNQFFDSRIQRELDRVQDVKTVAGQVRALEAIASEIQARIDATKDVTRRLNLEDRLLDVQRRAASISAAAADKAAKAEKDRLQKLRQAADARRQARQFMAIGLGAEGGDVIPRVANLRKQLDQLTSRSDIRSIPSKMQTALRGVGRVLSGEFGKVTAETRSRIQDLFDAIREELNKGASGGPLTKTTQLSSRILEGLGLSAADERILRARISHFNSSGTALAGTGAGSGSGNLTAVTVIDGKVVATTSAKYNRRTMRMNPSSRNGPNAGGWTGRG